MVTGLSISRRPAATPIGYQQNVRPPVSGNYRFTDIIRVGAPLRLVLWAVVIVFAPVVWPM